MSEILKNLWGKLYAWAFPSALALGAYWLFVHPQTSFGHDWLRSPSETTKTAIFAALSAAIGFGLNVFSTPLYRILEGYLFWPRWLQKRGTARQLKRKWELQAALTGTGWLRGLALEKLALYPLEDRQVVPTRFGNAIRSFETYGKTRFNLDSQTLWHELCAVAPKYIQTEMENARSSVDFFVALIYLSAGLGLVTSGVAVFDNFKYSIVIVAIVAFLVAVLSHFMVVRATGEWGFTIQALVNVGRVKLAEALGLQLPESLEEEKKMWGRVTAYVFFCKNSDGVEIDRFRKKPETKAPTASDGCGIPGSDEPEDGDDVMV